MTDAILGELEKQIHLLADRARGDLAAPVSYAVPGGKRVRGVLLILAGGRPAEGNTLLQAAACLELLHAATLVQDDIFDGSRTRRGRPAVHCAFGTRLATLASDWMLAEAIRSAYRLHFSFGDALSECAQTLMAGEAHELAPPRWAGMASLRARAAAIARWKTGELFGLALSAPAVLESSPGRASRLREAGCALGVAFQYLDDALDLYGDGQAAGKDLRRDAAARLWTLPMLDALGMVGGDVHLGGESLPGGAASLLAAAHARVHILAKARAQWQTAFERVLEQLSDGGAAGSMLRDVAAAMLASTEPLETRSAA